MDASLAPEVLGGVDAAWHMCAMEGTGGMWLGTVCAMNCAQSIVLGTVHATGCIQPVVTPTI